jgi:hypothetical protein
LHVTRQKAFAAEQVIIRIYKAQGALQHGPGRWRSALSDVQLIWFGLAVIIVFVAIVVAALSLLPVERR